MMEALLQDRVEFVELLLENGVSMSHFLTEKRLEELYRKTMDVSCTLKYMLEKCKVQHSFVYSDLGKIVDHLLDVTFNFADSEHQTDFLSQSLNIYNAFLLSPASGSNLEHTLRFKTPFHELLLWSVLCNRRKMALFMWERGEESLAKALIAGQLFKAIAKEMSKDDLMDDLCEGLERNAKEFYDIALGLLDECYRLHEDATQKLLTYHLGYWGGQTCLSLAVAMQHEEFVAHSCCQSIMTEIWMGAMRAGKWSTLKTVLGILVPPFIFTLEFKSRKKMSSMPVTYEEFEAERMDTRNQASQQVNYMNHSYENGADVEPTVQISGRQDSDRISLSDNHIIKESPSQISCVKKLYEFHRAPVTKFWANLIVYLMFLMLFAHLVLLKLEPFPKPLEWLLIVFVVTLLLEEIRQVVQSLPCTLFKKIKEWASNNWNICDFFGIVLFFVAVVLRFNPKTLAIGHIVYSLDIMLWIIRLLDIFCVNKDLGPYVVMIGRMTVDMLSFLLIMLVFLLAYGIAQQAILFPNEDPSWELISKILFRPYFQVYGELFIEEVDYSKNPEQTPFNTPSYDAYGGRLVTFIMAFYLLVANILLLNLLIAIFNNTFSMVQANANQIWKFQRYQLVMEYAQRPLLVPPFIVLGHLYRLLKTCWRRSTNGRKKVDRKLKLFLTKDELNKLMLFEEQCTESYLQKKAKVFSATQEERVKGISDRVDSNAFQLDKISKVVHSLEDRHSKLEEYTLQILDVVGHLQLMFPQTLAEHDEETLDSNGNEQDDTRGHTLEGAGYDRYIIQDDRTGPVFDRMVSMPAYMHQQVPSPRSSPRMYFRTKLPLTNPYQYRKQFNTGGSSVKKAIQKFRSNTLPRNISKSEDTHPETKAEYDQKDGYPATPSRGSNLSQKRAESLDTPNELEVPRRPARPRSSTMPSSSRNPTEYDNISHDHDLHIRARQSPYPNSDLHRYPVPDFLVDWQMPFPGYFPVNHSDPSVSVSPNWADVDISDPFYQEVQLRFNTVDNGVDRRSHMGVYNLFDGIPRNPMGRTGLGGRGLLGRWGPNHAADPIVTRWMKNEENEFFQRAGKRVLEFVAIQRCDCKEWAIPGGMVEVGETISETLKREFCEEALCSLEDTEEERKEKCARIKQFFAKGTEIYKGYVDDPRNTDNSWMETVAINFHDETGDILNDIQLKVALL
ncbi:transient receptor potential cation channel subfamily M member 3-like [Actinia tenebrosa]|uniref:Transient receptor potential cation channel subfamily M member 3-like n=1 Tax=Actinia tenebrosa TaxID=6105 RepID=A0A6P8IU98_ACTTE|nr:transient receptor potential cation channel subfamily M member 3-like [Actinia tenebrosa]